MLGVLREEPRRAITIIGDFVSGGLEFFDEARGAKGGGCFLEARLESGCARRRTNQSNLLRLTDNLDRQDSAPCDVFPRLTRATVFFFWTGPLYLPARRWRCVFL